MTIRALITGFVAVALTMTGVQPASAQEPSAQEPSTLAGSVRAAESKPWIKLAGTSGKVNDEAGKLRLASYSLVFDAGQGHYGYLREGGKFVKTPYRAALVAPGGRWVAGIPDYRLWTAQKKIDLIDRRTGRKHTVRLPAPVTSPEWSQDGRTLLLTAYDEHRDGSLTIIGFITLDVADRVARLVKAGPRHIVSNWSIGREFRFFFAGGSARVLARHNEADDSSPKSRIAVYDLRGQLRRYYTGVGAPDEWSAAQVFSPSGRLFATVVRDDDSRAQIRIVEAATGKVVHRFGGKDVRAFMGWYDDAHVIVQRERGRTQLFQRVDLSGGAGLDLIREKLVANPAEYEPHLERVNFVRSD
ncbi:hypothetical protein AB0C28_42825 [Nonomuraea sp. NPDC048892]|uniref:hypothetical protein n=1 Tax=Nonomuraea sp. NPDC048892 TaxID=3154624 RepID=UPI0033D30239